MEDIQGLLQSWSMLNQSRMHSSLAEVLDPVPFSAEEILDANQTEPIQALQMILQRAARNVQPALQFRDPKPGLGLNEFVDAPAAGMQLLCSVQPAHNGPKAFTS